MGKVGKPLLVDGTLVVDVTTSNLSDNTVSQALSLVANWLYQRGLDSGAKYGVERIKGESPTVRVTITLLPLPQQI